MENYLGVAKEVGINNEEIGAVQAIVMAVSGGRVMAQFNEVLIKSREPRGEEQHPTGLKAESSCCKE